MSNEEYDGQQILEDIITILHAKHECLETNSLNLCDGECYECELNVDDDVLMYALDVSVECINYVLEDDDE